MKRTGSQREAIARILKKLGIINITKAADGPSPLGHLIGNLFRKRNIVVPKIQLLPLKNIRIQQLVDAGFNCPAFQSWPRGGLKLEELRSFWKKYSRVSLRNYREENILEETPKLPVVYDQDDWNFIADFCRRYNEEYHTLVNEALPLKDSLTAGNIVLLDAERYAVVYFEGYGTPRDVDTDEKSSKLKMYLRRFGVKPPEWVPEGVQKPIGQLQKFLPDF